jgi:hypothetical protein
VPAPQPPPLGPAPRPLAQPARTSHGVTIVGSSSQQRRGAPSGHLRLGCGSMVPSRLLPALPSCSGHELLTLAPPFAQ